MKNKYTYQEWSQDTREYEIESETMLTADEIQDMALNCTILDGSTYSDADKNIKVTFKGTEFGDDSQTNISGDKIKEDEENEEKE